MDEPCDRGLAEAATQRQAVNGGSGLAKSRSDIGAIIATLLDRRSRSKREADVMRRQAQAARRSSLRRRAAQIQQWTSARTLLREAVVEIDAELTAVGCYLSMSDDRAASADLAAVEIRLFLDGHPCATTLDLTIRPDGRQAHADLSGDGGIHRGLLPSIATVTREDYRAAILAYVARVLTAERRAGAIGCHKCECF